MVDEMITVKITAYQKVEYNQYRQIPKSRFEKFEAMCDDGAEDYEICREFEDLINTADVCDADEIKDLDMQAVSPSPQESNNG